jgi:PAS domain S-box-containing protein
VARRITILAITSDPALGARLRSEIGAMDELVLVDNVEAAIDRLRLEPAVDVALLTEINAHAINMVATAGRLHAVQSNLPVVALAARPESRDLTAAVQTQELVLAVQDQWREGELSAAILRAYEIGRLRAETESLRMQMHRRLDALASLHEVSAALADVDSFEELSRVLSTEVHRVLHFDLAAAAIIPAPRAGPVLTLHCQERCSETAVQSIRDRCLEMMNSLGGRTVDERNLKVVVTGRPLLSTGQPGGFDDTTHAVVKVGDQARGFIMLAARAPTSFTDDDDKLLYYLANRAGEALYRVSRRINDQRRRLGDMVESMADGLILTDIDTEEVLINPSARRMLGIYSDVPVTKKFLKEKLGFYPFDLVATRATTGGTPAPLREEVKVGDRLLHSMVSPVRDVDGKLSGVVVVLRDMTEARELARRQNEFVSVVSHELRTPLTSITGSLDIVLGVYAGRLSEKQRRYLQMARDSCTRLNMIVDDLLDVARSESGRMPINFTPLMLDELAREVVDRYLPAAEGKGIEVVVTSDAKEIRIVGDPDRLTQVLNNLLSNAIKFTPQSGRIEVEIFGPSVASNHVGVSVYNNGEPIPAEDRERIFDKFEQLQESSTRRVGGTGLGLAISRAIIEAHRGRIWVEERADGTKFVFTLPSAPPAEEGNAVPVTIAESVTAPVEAGVKVIIALGDPRSTYILKGILMAAGHDVTVAGDTDAALAGARSLRPQLLVVDATSTAAEEALALIDIFNHDPDTRRTAVLAMGIPAELHDKAQSLGADLLMETPVAPVRFREACSRLIAEAGRVSAPRILVVDDDPAIRAICHDMLASAGYAVREVDNGVAAIAEARRFRPDLLILDVMMPDMDGFAAAEKLRSDSTTSLTPIIFLSAKGETADKVRAFRIGAEDYIVKPFDAAELVARVGKALERRQRELGASPTTLLPGADSIESEIEGRLEAGGEHAFCYLDLDNLKAFNDYYGYAKADAVIRQTGDLIRDVVAREGNPSDFIGHIAGDDFVFITSADRVDQVCETICTAFGRLVPLYYNRTDRERGYIETKDRYGVMRKFPIMGVSLAVVTQSESNIHNFSELAAAAAKGKKLAKAAIGSAYVRDEVLVVGELPAKADDNVA